MRKLANCQSFSVSPGLLKAAISYLSTTVYVESFARRKIFANFANFAIDFIGKIFYHTTFLSCVDDYIEDMATFTTLAKIYSTNYFCNTKVDGPGEIFVK